MSKNAKGPQITHLVKLLVPAGKAGPAPPVGPALGQRGVKAMDFCKIFNARTEKYVPGIPISTYIKVEPNRTFTFETQSPPTTWFLKQACGGLEKGSGRAGDVFVGELSVKHVYEIAKVKLADTPGLAGMSLEDVCKSVVGSAKSCGIQIKY
ncbi:hypothetical protein HDV00_002353 [Rhizophlyctis rosea]|nr:hypothetical protein HDV00_002353 [Rhizophlyctis rosea]